MRKPSVSVAVGLLCLIVKVAVAQGTPSGSQDRAARLRQPTGGVLAQKVARRAKLFGTVESVDLGSWKIVVRTDKGETRRVAISAGTKLDKGSNHKMISLADLKSGDPLTIIMDGKAVRTVHVYLASK